MPRALPQTIPLALPSLQAEPHRAHACNAIKLAIYACSALAVTITVA